MILIDKKFRYSEIKPIISYWHDLHYSDKYYASINALGIPPVWIKTVSEVIKCLEFLKEKTIWSYN